MKSKIYLVLYYLISLIIFFITIRNIFFSDMYEFVNSPGISFIFVIISFLLFLLVTVYLIIKKNININNKDILFMVVYLIFLIFIIISCLLFDKKLLVPYIEYHYYTSIVLIPYILLNINNLLSIKLKK